LLSSTVEESNVIDCHQNSDLRNLFINIENKTTNKQKKTIMSTSNNNLNSINPVLVAYLESAKLVRNEYKEKVALLSKLALVEAQIGKAEETLQSHINNMNALPSIESLTTQLKEKSIYLVALNSEISEFNSITRGTTPPLPLAPNTPNTPLAENIDADIDIDAEGRLIIINDGTPLGSLCDEEVEDLINEDREIPNEDSTKDIPDEVTTISSIDDISFLKATQRDVEEMKRKYKDMTPIDPKDLDELKEDIEGYIGEQCQKVSNREITEEEFHDFIEKVKKHPQEIIDICKKRKSLSNKDIAYLESMFNSSPDWGSTENPDTLTPLVSDRMKAPVVPTLNDSIQDEDVFNGSSDEDLNLYYLRELVDKQLVKNDGKLGAASQELILSYLQENPEWAVETENEIIDYLKSTDKIYPNYLKGITSLLSSMKSKVDDDSLPF
jgi:hypothetical protein